MVRLLNSAMMPSPEFCYCPQRITREQFIRLVREADARGELDSYIGYPSTADHIARISGVSVQINRSETKLERGDVILVCKLRYRLADPGQKGSAAAQAAITDEDFEYWLVEIK